MMNGLSDVDFAELSRDGWPPASMKNTLLLLNVAAVALAANVLATAPVFLASGWSVWRKAHHLLFAAAGVLALYGLWEWRLIFAPTTVV